ncbi:hypothetical protein ACH4VR_29650 [Streptomyces sp. NPDC020883]|uniref:hypothetical protein n=1 Tax=Streptomyces sp. NPDC020883 TaxID=3365099 RepID=UPI0037A3107E
MTTLPAQSPATSRRPGHQPTSRTTAMNLRFYLYAVTPGSVYTLNPHGPAPRTVQYTAAERADHARRLGDLLTLWQQTDPEGFALWTAATAAGDTDADPCAYCRECRTRR